MKLTERFSNFYSQLNLVCGDITDIFTNLRIWELITNGLLSFNLLPVSNFDKKQL